MWGKPKFFSSKLGLMKDYSYLWPMKYLSLANNPACSTGAWTVTTGTGWLSNFEGKTQAELLSGYLSLDAELIRCLYQQCMCCIWYVLGLYNLFSVKYNTNILHKTFPILAYTFKWLSPFFLNHFFPLWEHTSDIKSCSGLRKHWVTHIFLVLSPSEKLMYLCL